MVAVMLFGMVLVASFVIVRVGAIAFQLTGLEWSLAKFQALSCFSGTGFTTRESELVTSHPQRRKIATVLIILGNAGFVTMIATAASALNPKDVLWARLGESFLPFKIPNFLVMWVNIAVIVVIVYVVYKLFTNNKFLHRLTTLLRTKIIRKDIFNRVSFEELLMVTAGYGVTRMEVHKDSSLLNKTLAESDLRKNDVTVLAISRDDSMISNPPADTKILLGDELISFGNLEKMRDNI